MLKKVESLCKPCTTCLHCKPSREIPVPLLQYPEVTELFQWVHMDLVGPFPSSDGYRYIFTVVARIFVSAVVASEGTPYVITDGRGEFENEVCDAVCKQMGICLHTYHPNSNGQVERVNGTLM